MGNARTHSLFVRASGSMVRASGRYGAMGTWNWVAAVGCGAVGMVHGARGPVYGACGVGGSGCGVWGSSVRGAWGFIISIRGKQPHIMANTQQGE